jgi:hypothetical protein
MRLTVQELLAAVRRRKNYDDMMLELSGFTAGRIPRFLRREEIERIRAASGLAPASETPSERAWRRYFELTDPLIRQLAHINHAIGRALERSEFRVQEALEALETIRARATVDPARAGGFIARRTATEALPMTGTSSRGRRSTPSTGLRTRRTGSSARRRGNG